MELDRFTAGQLWIEATKHREGPPLVYVCKSGETSMLFTKPAALLKFVRWPKSTPTGQALREWLASFEQEPEAPSPELDTAKHNAEGSGPEAHSDDAIENTKMVFDRYLQA